MRGNPNLRNAIIAQGIALAIAGAAAIALALHGESNLTVFTFVALGSVVALVLNVWSFVFSIRAFRAGATWGWTAVVWALVEIELLAPADVYWLHMANTRSNALGFSIFIAVGLPVLAVTACFVLAVVLALRRWKRPRLIAVSAGLLYTALILTVAPAAIYVTAVAVDRTNMVAYEKSHENRIVAATPVFFRDGVDRFLAKSNHGVLHLFHLILCERGLLSLDRTIENLGKIGSVSNATWDGLEQYRFEMALQISTDIATGKSKTPGAQLIYDSMGALLATEGSDDQVKAVFLQLKDTPKSLRGSFIAYIKNRPHVEDFEYLAVHRQCTEFDFLAVVADALPQNHLSALGLNSQIVAPIYSDWAYMKNNPGEQRGRILGSMSKSCIAETKPQIRRLYATALADVLNLELHHVPFADALTKEGKPVPVTLDESEEIVSVCNQAEAEAVKSSERTKP